jgi:hypothetical protein
MIIAALASRLTFPPPPACATRSYAWTQRVCGFIILYLVTFGWLTLRPRLPPKKVKGGMFNLAAFKAPKFSLYVAGCWLIMLGSVSSPSHYRCPEQVAESLARFCL